MSHLLELYYCTLDFIGFPSDSDRLLQTRDLYE